MSDEEKYRELLRREQEFRLRLEKEKEEQEYQEWKQQNEHNSFVKAPSPQRDLAIWGTIILGILLVALFLNFPLLNDKKNKSNTDSQNGKWITKCRTITEPNPNYYDADISSITDNLTGPPRFIFRKQCTDVWVND